MEPIRPTGILFYSQLRPKKQETIVEYFNLVTIFHHNLNEQQKQSGGETWTLNKQCKEYNKNICLFKRKAN